MLKALVKDFFSYAISFSWIEPVLYNGIECLGQDSDPQDSDPICNMKVTGKGHKKRRRWNSKSRVLPSTKYGVFTFTDVLQNGYISFTLYHIKTPFNTFANRADPEQAALVKAI